eukprot:4533235-Amphidinium_carterae.1
MSFIGLALASCLFYINGCFAYGRLVLGVGDAVVKGDHVDMRHVKHGLSFAPSFELGRYVIEKRGLSFAPSFKLGQCGDDFEVEIGRTSAFRLDCQGGLWLFQQSGWRKVGTAGNEDIIELVLSADFKVLHCFKGGYLLAEAKVFGGILGLPPVPVRETGLVKDLRWLVPEGSFKGRPLQEEDWHKKEEGLEEALHQSRLEAKNAKEELKKTQEELLFEVTKVKDELKDSQEELKRVKDERDELLKQTVKMKTADNTSHQKETHGASPSETILTPLMLQRMLDMDRQSGEREREMRNLIKSLLEELLHKPRHQKAEEA